MWLATCRRTQANRSVRPTRFPISTSRCSTANGWATKPKAVSTRKSEGAEGKEDERVGLDWKTLEYRPRQKAKFPALDMAKNVEDTGGRAPHAARHRWPAAKRRQSRSLPLVRALRSLELLRQPHPGNFRHHRRNRPRHEARLQLGARPLRTLGRRRSRGHSSSHEKRRKANSRKRREAAVLRQKILVQPTKPKQAAPTGN